MTLSTQSRSSGKERDTETGLDYFGARYYGSNMGRFMSADPLYIEAKRLADPQKLNLYAYARNNPLKFVDPTGLEIAVNCANKQDCNTAEQQLNDRQRTLLSWSDQNGKLVAQQTVAGPLDAQDSALLNASNDPNTTATLNVVNGSGSVTFGTYDKDNPGTNTVDVADTAKLAGAGLSPGNAIGHEILEAYSMKSGASFPDAHTNDPIPGFINGRLGLTLNGAGDGVGQQFNMRMTGTTSPTYHVDMTFRTPIPAATLNTLTPANVQTMHNIQSTQADVQEVKKQ